MARFAVTFRIHDDSGYSDRYNSFTTEVRKGVAHWWAGTTSFYAIETAETLDAYCRRIWLNSTFDGSKDVYVVVNVETGAGRSRGPVSDRDLFRAFPGVIEI